MLILLEHFLPHLNIALSLSLLVVAILDIYNPMMGFLHGRPAIVLIGLTCTVSIMNAIFFYASQRRARNKK